MQMQSCIRVVLCNYNDYYFWSLVLSLLWYYQYGFVQYDIGMHCIRAVLCHDNDYNLLLLATSTFTVVV